MAQVISVTTADSRKAGNYGHSVRLVAAHKRVSGSDCVIDTASAQASAPLLWGAGAELIVAGAGDGAGWAEAGGGEQAPAAKGSGCSQRRHAGWTPGAIFVGQPMLCFRHFAFPYGTRLTSRGVSNKSD